MERRSPPLAWGAVEVCSCWETRARSGVESARSEMSLAPSLIAIGVADLKCAAEMATEIR